MTKVVSLTEIKSSSINRKWDKKKRRKFLAELAKTRYDDIIWRGR